ncbi:MAG: hypothetical protein FJ356_05075 [Thaumarchaeota archaeon]|nr:hypothetical protein [Nitrososphaerota archaeon]
MLIEISAIVGAITGSVSLGIVVYKTIKDKPSLQFEIENQYFYVPREYENFTNITIVIKIHNRGERNTTVHSSELSFSENGKNYNLHGKDYAASIPPDSSVTTFFQFELHKKDGEIKSKKFDGNIIISYTHGKKEMKVTNIERIN